MPPYLLALAMERPPNPTLFPYTTLFRSRGEQSRAIALHARALKHAELAHESRAIGLAHYRSEEHTSELQSQSNLVCRVLLEKQKHKALSDIKHNRSRMGSTLARPAVEAF